MAIMERHFKDWQMPGFAHPNFNARRPAAINAMFAKSQELLDKLRPQGEDRKKVLDYVTRACPRINLDEEYERIKSTQNLVELEKIGKAMLAGYNSLDADVMFSAIPWKFQ